MATDQQAGRCRAVGGELQTSRFGDGHSVDQAEHTGKRPRSQAFFKCGDTIPVRTGFHQQQVRGLHTEIHEASSMDHADLAADGGDRYQQPGAPAARLRSFDQQRLCEQYCSRHIRITQRLHLVEAMDAGF